MMATTVIILGRNCASTLLTLVVIPAIYEGACLFTAAGNGGLAPLR